MADVIHTRETDTGGSGVALGIVLGVVLVLVLLVGAWWLFFRQPAVVTPPNTTIIEQEQPPAQEAPQGDTNINIDEGDGTTGGSETSPAP